MGRGPSSTSFFFSFLLPSIRMRAEISGLRETKVQRGRSPYAPVVHRKGAPIEDGVVACRDNHHVSQYPNNTQHTHTRGHHRGVRCPNPLSCNFPSHSVFTEYPRHPPSLSVMVSSRRRMRCKALPGTALSRRFMAGKTKVRGSYRMGTMSTWSPRM